MDFVDVIERIKDIISLDIGNRRVKDVDVAGVLEIEKKKFFQMKRGNIMPINEIIGFCALRKISINWLLFSQDIDSLKKQTEKFMCKIA